MRAQMVWSDRPILRLLTICLVLVLASLLVSGCATSRPASLTTDAEPAIASTASEEPAVRAANTGQEARGALPQTGDKPPGVAGPVEVATDAEEERAPAPMAAQEVDECVGCHAEITPGIVLDWRSSKHAAAQVSCAVCHTMSAPEREDAFEHAGMPVVTVVTPADCGNCHARESQEFQASRHAEAAKFVGSLDNFLGEVVGGGPAADAGCKQCHGSTLTLVEGKPGVFDPRTWPNTGIGRVNPDGSRGTCTACHSRHAFSVAQARQPEVCGKCHIGPDHPQYEVWWESKHGARYYEMQALGESMNLNKPAGEWWPGRDYAAGPTCASCHISATPNQPVTHDVGARISWTLRPPVSTLLDNWEKKRAAMQDVCVQCHSPLFTTNFYAQFDALVTLYNEKFAIPAQTLMNGFYESGKLTETPFDEEIEWVYWELWHHEGRRARHGASMAGPDYTWWHGLYEVAKHFYTEFIPLARELDEEAVAKVLSADEHKWLQGLSEEEIKQILEFYQERYGQQP